MRRLHDGLHQAELAQDRHQPEREPGHRPEAELHGRNEPGKDDDRSRRGDDGQDADREYRVRGLACLGGEGRGRLLWSRFLAQGELGFHRHRPASG